MCPTIQRGPGSWNACRPCGQRGVDPGIPPEPGETQSCHFIDWRAWLLPITSCLISDLPPAGGACADGGELSFTPENWQISGRYSSLGCGSRSGRRFEAGPASQTLVRRQTDADPGWIEDTPLNYLLLESCSSQRCDLIAAEYNPVSKKERATGTLETSQDESRGGIITVYGNASRSRACEKTGVVRRSMDSNPYTVCHFKALHAWNNRREDIPLYLWNVQI